MTHPDTRPFRFHAFEVSYFSAKVRPALRYKQLWYEEVRADLGEIFERTGLGFIPIVVTPENETWQDSTEIFDRLEARVPEPPLFPRSPVQRIAAHLVELYTDEFGLIPAMHYRWGSAYGEATARARFSAMVGSEEVGNAAADRMAMARIALGATDEAAPAIESDGFGKFDDSEDGGEGAGIRAIPAGAPVRGESGVTPAWGFPAPGPSPLSGKMRARSGSRGSSPST